eukprot:2704103-Pleurochrysis_carterae.AAC.2
MRRAHLSRISPTIELRRLFNKPVTTEIALWKYAVNTEALYRSTGGAAVDEAEPHHNPSYYVARSIARRSADRSAAPTPTDRLA